MALSVNLSCSNLRAAENSYRVMLLGRSDAKVPEYSARSLTPGQAAILRGTFINAVTRLNLANGDRPDWWLTWLSSRDRFRSRLWDRMVALARMADLRSAHTQTPAADFDRAAAGATGGKLPGEPWVVQHFGLRVSALFENILVLAKHVWRDLKRILAARRHAARVPHDHNLVDVIIVTILTERAVATAGLYDDVYFGRLHEWLAAAGQHAIYCGFPEGDAERILSRAVRRQDVIILSYSHFLSIVDVIWALSRALFARFRVPPLPLPWGSDAAPLVHAELRRERFSLFEGLLIRRAMARLLAHHPRARLISMYENNGWERANYQAAKQATPPRPVIGYLHCSVLRSHMKNVFPREEHGLRPMPDRVVTTGPAARDVLLSIGDYPPGLVVDGCGLRAPLLSQIAEMPPPRRPVRTVLALFEGLMSVVPALQLFERAAKARPDLRFLVRCHPQLPIETLAPMADVPYGPAAAIDVSRAAALDDALQETDVVAYVSSTAVLHALYAGRPVIKLDIDETLDDDPLTACSAMKWRAANVDGFLRALAEIDAMEGSAAAAEARRYLEAYLREPDMASIAPFLEA